MTSLPYRNQASDDSPPLVTHASSKSADVDEIENREKARARSRDTSRPGVRLSDRSATVGLHTRRQPLLLWREVNSRIVTAWRIGEYGVAREPGRLEPMNGQIYTGP